MHYRTVLSYRSHAQQHPLLVVDATLACTLCFLPNLLMGISFIESATHALAPLPMDSWQQAVLYLQQLTLPRFLLWSGTNIALVALLCASRRHIFYPMVGIVKQMYSMLAAIAQEAPKQPPVIFSMRTIAGDMARMAQLAQEYYHKHHDATCALHEARRALTQITAQQQAIFDSTSREMIKQYESVLVYANYLEEQISRQTIDSTLRYDFDEVSESGFNLKLIAGALSLLQRTQIAPMPIHLAELIQQTLLALSPSLDRRSMKLTTASVDLTATAQSDPAIIAHVIWMMLLGTIRYAAEESTLHLSCGYNADRTRSQLSLIVSELCPGRMSEDERGAYQLRQLQHLNPHMFAETIRIHANIQLAEMLMSRLEGHLTVIPLTSYSCEICLSLPASLTAET